MGFHSTTLGPSLLTPPFAGRSLQQRPLMEVFPDSAAAKAFTSLARIIQKTDPPLNHGTIQFFWKRLLNL